MNDIYFWGACGVFVYLVAVYVLIALLRGARAVSEDVNHAEQVGEI